MHSTLKRTNELTPKLYETIIGEVIILVNKINSDGTMRGMVVHSKVSKYKIGDYYDNLEFLKPYTGEITLSN